MWDCESTDKDSLQHLQAVSRKATPRQRHSSTAYTSGPAEETFDETTVVEFNCSTLKGVYVTALGYPSTFIFQVKYLKNQSIFGPVR
jgi:hypothetical protein